MHPVALPLRDSIRDRSPRNMPANRFSPPATDSTMVHISAASTADRMPHAMDTMSLDQISWLRLTGRVNIR